jgi:hypothetical protein
MRIVANLLRQFGPAGGSAPPAPAAPTFTVADNGDGSGGVVTVAGSTPGSTNTFLAAPWSGGFAAAAFVSQGSRTGDGTLNISPGTGYFWGLVRSEKSGQSTDSAVRGFQITSAAQAVYYRCLAAVAARIQTLGLAGVAGSSVVVRKTPWNRRLTKPGVFVTPTREASFAAATNLRDSVPYGVQITIVRAANEDLSGGLDTALAWREQIARALRQNTLAGVDEVYTVELEPGPVLDSASFGEQYDVQTLMVRCHAREPRA